MNMENEISTLLKNMLEPYQRKLDQASKKMDTLAVRLDPMLDRPMDDNTPKYCCGDALEEIKCAIDETSLQITYAKQIVGAFLAAWEYELREGDEYDDVRTHFIHGYMDAINKVEKVGK